MEALKEPSMPSGRLRISTPSAPYERLYIIGDIAAPSQYNGVWSAILSESVSINPDL